MSSLPPLVFLIALVFVGPGLPAQTGAAQQPENVPPAKFTLKTEVNRVVLDVVVNDAHGNPVRGLSASDFTVIEDGVPQTVLQFDARNFDRGMDYTPAKFPPLPPHTFVNLPADPERGPLYVLYYDLVNIPVEYQVFRPQATHQIHTGEARRCTIRHLRSFRRGSYGAGIHL